jgi:hypothetical protein
MLFRSRSWQEWDGVTSKATQLVHVNTVWGGERENEQVQSYLQENFIQNCHYNIITLEAAPKMVGRQRSLTLRLYNTNGFPLVAKHGKYLHSLTHWTSSTVVTSYKSADWMITLFPSQCCLVIAIWNVVISCWWIGYDHIIIWTILLACKCRTQCLR